MDQVPRIFSGVSLVYLLFCLSAYSLAAQSDAGREQALAWIRQGDKAIAREEYAEAEPFFQQALAYFDARGDCYHGAYCYLWLGESAYALGRFRQALELSYSAERLLDDCPDRDTISFYSVLLQNLGVFHSKLGQFDQQMIYYRKAFQVIMAREGRQSERGADAYFNMGAAYGRKGQWEKAMMYWDTSLQIARKVGYRDGEASTYLNLSFVFGLRRDYFQAIDFQKKALRLTGSREEKARGYNNLGVLYSEEGSHDDALRCLHQALKLRREAGLPPYHDDILSTRLNLARAYLAAGKPGRAGPYIDQVIQSLDQADAPDQAYRKVAYHYKAILFLGEGRLQEAERLAREAMRIYGRQLDIDGSTRLVLGRVLLARGQYEAALEQVQAGLSHEVRGFKPESVFDNPALEQIEKTGDVLDLLDLKARIFYRRGAARGDLGDLRQSLAIYQYADGLVAFARRTFIDPHSRELLSASVADLYAGAMAAGAALYRLSGEAADFNRLFSYAEKNKSLLVLEKMHDFFAKDYYGIPQTVVERERRLLQDIDYLTGQIARARQRSSIEAGLLEQWEDTLFVRRREQEALFRDLQQRFPDYYALRHEVAPVSPALVRQKLLGPNEVLLQYFITDSTLYLLLVGKSGNHLIETPLGGQLSRLVEQYLKSLRERSADFYRRSHQLYQILLAPAAEHIRGKKLLVVPDGPLGYLPFETLLADSISEARFDRHYELPYVLRQHSLRYVFSASLALHPAGRQLGSVPGKVLGMAPDFDASAPTGLPPLPGSREEVRLLKQFFQGQFWVGRAARESRLKKSGDRYRLLHIATHTLVNERYPELSTLVFAPEQAGSTDDGMLHAYELYNLRLSAGLVVLSACNTGVGAIRRGEGIASMARAFAYAGCPNLVMSLWPVGDRATARLMANFYQNLDRGLSKAEAWHQARLQYLEQENDLILHPYYWGAFLYLGDREVLELRKKGSIPYGPWPLAGLLLGLALLGWWITRRYRLRA